MEPSASFCDVEGAEPLLRKLTLRPWCVLGNKDRHSAEPDTGTAIMDVTTVERISNRGPRLVSQAPSKDIYEYVGISELATFPREVTDSIVHNLDAKEQQYGNVHVIHSAWTPFCGEDDCELEQNMTIAYGNVLAEFAKVPNCTRIRFVAFPVGQTCAQIKELLTQITLNALGNAWANADDATKRAITQAWTMEFCVPLDEDYDLYKEQFDHIQRTAIVSGTSSESDGVTEMEVCDDADGDDTHSKPSVAQASRRTSDISETHNVRYAGCIGKSSEPESRRNSHHDQQIEHCPRDSRRNSQQSEKSNGQHQSRRSSRDSQQIANAGDPKCLTESESLVVDSQARKDSQQSAKSVDNYSPSRRNSHNPPRKSSQQSQRVEEEDNNNSHRYSEEALLLGQGQGRFPSSSKESGNFLNDGQNRQDWQHHSSLSKRSSQDSQGPLMVEHDQGPSLWCSKESGSLTGNNRIFNNGQKPSQEGNFNNQPRRDSRRDSQQSIGSQNCGGRPLRSSRLAENVSSQNGTISQRVETFEDDRGHTRRISHNSDVKLHSSSQSHMRPQHSVHSGACESKLATNSRNSAQFEVESSAQRRRASQQSVRSENFDGHPRRNSQVSENVEGCSSQHCGESQQVDNLDDSRCHGRISQHFERAINQSCRNSQISVQLGCPEGQKRRNSQQSAQVGDDSSPSKRNSQHSDVLENGQMQIDDCGGHSGRISQQSEKPAESRRNSELALREVAHGQSMRLSQKPAGFEETQHQSGRYQSENLEVRHSQLSSKHSHYSERWENLGGQLDSKLPQARTSKHVVDSDVSEVWASTSKHNQNGPIPQRDDDKKLENDRPKQASQKKGSLFARESKAGLGCDHDAVRRSNPDVNYDPPLRVRVSTDFPKRPIDEDAKCDSESTLPGTIVEPVADQFGDRRSNKLSTASIPCNVACDSRESRNSRFSTSCAANPPGSSMYSRTCGTDDDDLQTDVSRVVKPNAAQVSSHRATVSLEQVGESTPRYSTTSLNQAENYQAGPDSQRRCSNFLQDPTRRVTIPEEYLEKSLNEHILESKRRSSCTSAQKRRSAGSNSNCRVPISPEKSPRRELLVDDRHASVSSDDTFDCADHPNRQPDAPQSDRRCSNFLSDPSRRVTVPAAYIRNSFNEHQDKVNRRSSDPGVAQQPGHENVRRESTNRITQNCNRYSVCHAGASEIVRRDSQTSNTNVDSIADPNRRESCVSNGMGEPQTRASASRRDTSRQSCRDGEDDAVNANRSVRGRRPTSFNQNPVEDTATEATEIQSVGGSWHFVEPEAHAASQNLCGRQEHAAEEEGTEVYSENDGWLPVGEKARTHEVERQPSIQYKRVDIDTTNHDALRSIKWRFNANGAYVNQLGRHFPPDVDLKVGDQLVVINHASVEGIQKEKINQIWREQQLVADTMILVFADI